MDKDTDALLPQNTSSIGVSAKSKATEIWRHKRTRQKSGLFPKGFAKILVLWIALNVVIQYVGFLRLLHIKVNPMHETYPKVMYSEVHDLNESDYVSIGVHLLVAGYGIAVLAIFTFICLPFDSDKVRLKKGLLKWLLFNLLLIVLIASLCFAGAFLVIKYDGKFPIAGTEGTRSMTLFCLNGAMLIAPVIAASYHVFFWRKAYVIYDSIDVTKELVWAIRM